MSELRINSKIIILYVILINILVIICFLINMKISLVNYLCIVTNLFLPGLIVLGLLNKRLENITTAITLSLGLSIFFLTFACLLANDVLPFIGIKKPITAIPLNTFTLILVTVISIIYLKKIKYIIINNPQIIWSKYAKLSRLTIIFIFIILILVSSILGTLVLKKTNIVIIFSFILLSTIPILLYFRIIPKNLYPFLIWICALSLVLYNSLFGKYMRPTDNVFEIFTIKEFVLKNNIWENKASINVLAMPCVVLLIPYLSFLTGSIVQTYKLIVPFLASFIPIIIYNTFRVRYGDEVAIYSSLFYSFMFSYFTWNSITMKMVTAAINLSLLSMLLSKLSLNNKLNLSDKLIILVFSVSLVFSHYGTSAIYGIVLMLTSITLIIFEKIHKIQHNNFWKTFKNYTMFYLVIYYGYSLYITNGSIFDSVVTTIHNTLTGITELFSPENYGSELVISSVPIYLQILKILYIISYILIVIGILSEVIEKLKEKSIDIYNLISIFFAILLAVPYAFPSQYGSGRIWFISSIFISPYLIIGFERILCHTKLLKSNQSKFAFIAIFITIFFVFNSGLASEVIWKHNVSPSIYISYPRIIKNGTLWEREYLDRVTLSIEDICSAFWLYKYHVNKKIYCDINAQQNLVFVGFSRGDLPKKVGDLPLLILISENKKIYKNRYIYLSKFNIETGLIKVGGRIKPKLVKINSIINLNSTSVVYTNGYSKILYY